MMNFIERVTGSDITKAMKNLSVRIQNLSPAYQDAWDEMQSCLYTYGDFTGRNLLPVLRIWRNYWKSLLQKIRAWKRFWAVI